MCLWRQDKKLANRSSNCDQNEDVSVVKWYQKKTFLRLLLSGCIVAGVVGLKSLHAYCNRNRALLTISLDHGKLDPSKLQTFANKVLGLLALSETKDVTKQSVRQELNGLVLNAKIQEDGDKKYFEIYLGKTDQTFMRLQLSMNSNIRPHEWSLEFHTEEYDVFAASEIVDLSDEVLSALNAKTATLRNSAHIRIDNVPVHLDFMSMIDPKEKTFKTFYGAHGYTCDGAGNDQVAELMESIHNYDIKQSPEMLEKFHGLDCNTFGQCMKMILDKDKERSATIYQELGNSRKLPPDWTTLNQSLSEKCENMRKEFKITPEIGGPCDPHDTCQGDLICEQFTFGQKPTKICVKDPKKMKMAKDTTPNAEELSQPNQRSDEDVTPKFEKSGCNAQHNILPLVFVHFVFVCLYFYLY